MPIPRALVEEAINKVSDLADPGPPPQRSARTQQEMDAWRAKRATYVGELEAILDPIVLANNDVMPPGLMTSPRGAIANSEEMKDNLNNLLASLPTDEGTADPTSGGRHRRRRSTRRRGNRTRKSRRKGRGQTR